jgi:hypothetical protein
MIDLNYNILLVLNYKYLMNLYIITLLVGLAFISSADLSVYNLEALGIKD